eukprot:gene27677-33426_t
MLGHLMEQRRISLEQEEILRLESFASEQRRIEHNAIFLQATVRQFLARRRLVHLKQAREAGKRRFVQSIVRVQSWVRCVICRSRFRVLQLSRRAAEDVQLLKDKARMQLGLSKLHQLFARATLKPFLLRSREVLCDQRKVKEAQAQQRIAKMWRLKTIPQQLHRFLARWRAVAALYRGYRIRSRLPAKLRRLLDRVRESAKQALSSPHTVLGKQTLHALEMLQRGRMISELKRACQMLFVSTNHSTKCCEAFTYAGAFKILFDLMKSCNRSTPHQELLRLALIVLQNASRHEHLAREMGKAPYVLDILLDLLQTYRDKHTLFLLGGGLLLRLCVCSDELRQACMGAGVLKRIQGIYMVVKRRGVGAVGGTASKKAAEDKEQDPLQLLEQILALLK